MTQNGDHADVAFPGASTGSQATGKTSGVVALLVARSRELADLGQLERPLTVLEAEQVIEQSADGVTDLMTISSCPCPPSEPLAAAGAPDPPATGTTPPRATSAKPDGSWSNYFGYGRVNARRALEMLGSTAGTPTPTGNNSPALPVKIPTGGTARITGLVGAGGPDHPTDAGAERIPWRPSAGRRPDQLHRFGGSRR